MSSGSFGEILPPPEVIEVAPSVFAYIQPDGTWWINNSGFVVGAETTLVVDSSSTERRTQGLVAAVDKHHRPVRQLVNTHHHGDHTHGNYLFPEATVIGHHRCREELLAAGPPSDVLGLIWEAPDWGDIRLAPPTVTFDDSVTVWVDDLACRVDYIGMPAHTTNDCVVWLAEQGVLFSGDLLFNGGTPFLLAGSVAGARQAVERLRQYGAETIVPGHGPPCGPAVIDRVAAYLAFVEDLAADALARGHAPLEAARRCDLGTFGAWSDRERIVGNLYRAMAELDGLAQGAPLDLAKALTEMVSFNGGHRLHCHA